MSTPLLDRLTTIAAKLPDQELEEVLQYAESVAQKVQPNGTPPDKETPIGQSLVAISRRWADRTTHLPDDLASEHDHYLHGLPKRS
jgi:hypothetical protein